MSRFDELVTFVRHVAVHPSSPRNRAAALARFGYRQLHKRLSGAPLVVQWEGLELEIPSDARFAAAAFYFGRPDRWEFAFLERFLRPGDTVLDVGANVGVYTLFLAKQVGPTGRVIACEPEPTNLARLRANVQRNRLSQVEIVAAAIGGEEGTARFALGRDTVGHLLEGATDQPALEVPVTTLDRLCAERSPAYAKIDVEGFEDLVIAGARALLARGLPLVLQVELGEEEARRRSPVAPILEAQGYSFFAFDPASKELVARDPRRPGGNNLLAVRRPAEVLARLQSAR